VAGAGVKVRVAGSTSKSEVARGTA
jgi:hypothetical protein